MKLLEVKNLTIKFRQKESMVEAVHNLHLTLNQGETLGIVGESGSGKSVTAMSITKLLASNAEYSDGEIWYTENNSEPVNLFNLSESELRPYRGNKISIIFQEPLSSLNPVLTCGYQVSEALLAHQKATKKDVRSKVIYWFEKVGLDEPDRTFDSYPHQLSGGQLQRVLIALALCCEPKIVIADEPTTALDVNIQKRILELLNTLKAELGLTIIFISHDLGVIRYLCDRVMVMNGGIKVEENTVEELFTNPNSSYTKGLINSRPPLRKKLKRLPTVLDFTSGNTAYNWYLDENIIHSTEQDRKLIQLHSTKPLISIEGLTIRYPLKRNWFGKTTEYFDAVKNFNLNIHRGETVGIVGESGSGKSSLGKGILNLVEVQSGTVKYNDIVLTSLNSQEWRPLRKDLQIIFQDPYSSLNPRKTIGSSIVEPMEVHRLYDNNKQRKERAIYLLECVGLEADHFQRYPHQFSGGQRQRICIARALGLNAKFIVCDESVSALDVSIQAQVLNLLMELKDNFHLSLLFITHDVSVVNFISDRVVVMQKGEIVEEGKPYEIINQPKSNYTKTLISSIIE